MLVLSRRVDESILLIDAAGVVLAEIMLVAIGGGKAGIGVEALPDVTIQRREIVACGAQIGGSVPFEYVNEPKSKERRDGEKDGGERAASEGPDGK